MTFEELKIGDVVVRMLAGSIPMELKITDINDEQIFCGPWAFDMKTGAEIDELLNWGPPPQHTGSYLKLEDRKVPYRSD